MYYAAKLLIVLFVVVVMIFSMIIYQPNVQIVVLDSQAKFVDAKIFIFPQTYAIVVIMHLLLSFAGSV